MKLYFSPGACSLSPHIALRETGLTFDLERVNLATKQTSSGLDYKTINPKGSVPALQFDNGQVLTEGPAIVQWIADQKPASRLAPPNGTMERYRLQEWLNFITSELHKTFSPLFNPKVPEDYKTIARDIIAQKLDFVTRTLEQRPFLTGEDFTVADAYLFTVLRWTKTVQIDLSRWPKLVAFQERVNARPAVRAAIEAETR